MKPSLTCLCILLFCVFNLSAQINNEKELTRYMNRQDSLFHKAYNNRDTKTYEALLPGFITNYNKLTADQKKTFRGKYASAYYNLCCAYSLLNQKQPALDYLEKSIKAGYYDYLSIQEDPDLVNIRNETRYNTLVQPTREIGDYPYILQKSGKYNINDNREIPKFTYQDSSDPHLVLLRKTYKLDSIAGTGSDVLKIINLLHWVHFLVPHGSAKPDEMNAMSLIAVSKKDKLALNCRGLAAILNECYLSLGIKSRVVTCMPKDSLGIDDDVHVINMVYANSLKKWIWIDPTHDAYVMNEKGELLGIEEVRDRLINGKQLIINPDANWNRKARININYYLYYYMTKNLYILKCFVNNEYNIDTRETGKTIAYVKLLPLNYFDQGPDKSTSNVDGTTYIIYKTNTRLLFGKRPKPAIIQKPNKA